MNLIVSNTKGNMINREGHEGKNLTFFFQVKCLKQNLPMDKRGVFDFNVPE